VTERVRKNTQVVSDAAYKGVHPHIVEMDRRPGIIVDLKVWRTDPGSIFDLDPLEDNIQSRSLHMLSGTAYILSSSPFTWFCPESEATLSGRSSWYQLCDLNFKVEDLKNQKKKKKMLCSFKIPLIIYENKLSKGDF